MTQKQINFDQTVRDRIESLLARCDAIKRGSDLKHTRFDARGQREAAEIARRDQEKN